MRLGLAAAILATLPREPRYLVTLQVVGDSAPLYGRNPGGAATTSEARSKP